MPETPLRVAYVTAGAAGMYCGSCMRDNTLAAALTRQGIDVQLIPTYTPIRTDEKDVSIDRVFFGGINIYLEERVPGFRWLPAALVRWLDQPWLIRLASKRARALDYRMLGGLTVSMLRGKEGHQRREVDQLVDWLERDVRPRIVTLSNMLIAGCVPEIKRRLNVPVLVTLQGDDIFLNELPEPFREQALIEIRRLVAQVDGFLVFSQFYADLMGQLFQIPPEKFHIVPMGVELRDLAVVKSQALAERPVDRPPTIGFLARLAPEKGLHHLVEAFIQLRQRPGMEEARLLVAGWLGESNRKYAEREFDRLRQAGLEAAFHYAGSVSLQAKYEFLSTLDVLSVPTTYEEPKGIYVLEALACGVPVVQPAHGAFPELIASTGGGRLVRPGDSAHLTETLHALLLDHNGRRELGEQGRQRVHDRFHADAMADATLAIYQRHLASSAQPET